MKFIKISNLQDMFNQVDYKGLDLNKFIAGSQVYMPDLSQCLIATAEVDIPSHSDILELTENEYHFERQVIIEIINSLPKPKTLEEANAEIETLKMMVAELGLQIGGGL